MFCAVEAARKHALWFVLSFRYNISSKKYDSNLFKIFHILLASVSTSLSFLFKKKKKFFWLYHVACGVSVP